MKQDIKLNPAFIAIIVSIAAFSRILPHPTNFSPLGAISLIGGFYLSKKHWALIIPILSIWLSDLFINNFLYAQYYPQFTWFYEGFYWQYISYILIGFLGISIQNNKPSYLLGMSLVGSVLFFLISNFGCFMSNPIYSKDLTGLFMCYTAGIPFFSATIAGDLFYTVSLGLMIHFAAKILPNLRTVNA